MDKDERTAILEANQNNMVKDIFDIKKNIESMWLQMTKNHQSIIDKFDALETKFVLRSEFKVAITIITAIATIIWILSYFLDK